MYSILNGVRGGLLAISVFGGTQVFLAQLISNGMFTMTIAGFCAGIFLILDAYLATNISKG